MKVVFMGTPDFSVPALTALFDGGHEIKYAVTQPDKAKDRGKKVQATPVKEKAKMLGIEVLQPQTIAGDHEFMMKLRDYGPDIIIVVAYGKILPQELIDLPKFGCLNIHASLLPRWRGAAPIQRAVIEGDEETGVTIMRIAKSLDTGDMFDARKTPIGEKTSGQLHEELSVLGGQLLMETIASIQAGTATPVPQDDSMATYAHMISKKEGKLDFADDHKKLARLVRGLDPWPGAYADYKGVQMKIRKAVAIDKKNAAKSGTITDVSESGIEVSAGGNTLLVTEIQMPGKKKMAIKDYLKGNKIEKFSVLG